VCKGVIVLFEVGGVWPTALPRRRPAALVAG
jgi:hypothetical protein